jgi:hypothetical protein
MRMLANIRRIAILTDIDPLDSRPSASEKRLRELTLGTRERKHRTVMVSVRVHVEQARHAVIGECASDRLNGRL